MQILPGSSDEGAAYKCIAAVLQYTSGKFSRMSVHRGQSGLKVLGDCAPPKVIAVLMGI